MVSPGLRALAIATELEDVPLQVIANQVTAQTYHDLADYPAAIELFRRNVALLTDDLLGERFGLATFPSVSSRAILAWCHAWQGDFQPARVLAEQALAIAESHKHPASLAIACLGAGFAYLLQSDIVAAVPLLERATTTYASLHFKNPAAVSMQGWAYALAGRVDESFPLFERSLDMAAAIKFLPCNSIWIVWWGEAHLRQGQFSDAMDRAVRALDLARAQQEPAYEAYALHLVGEITACQRSPHIEPLGSGKLSHPGSPIVSQSGSPILSHPGSAIVSHLVGRDRIPSSFSPSPEILAGAHWLQEVTSGGTEESGDRHP